MLFKKISFKKKLIFIVQGSEFITIFAPATVPKGLIGNIVKSDNSPRCCKF